MTNIPDTLYRKRHPRFGFTRSAERVSSESRTIPDDSFTIGELFARFSKGAPLPMGIERPVSYGDSPAHADLSFEAIQRMDLVEIHDLKKRVGDTLQAIQGRQKALEAPQAPPNDPNAQQAPNGPQNA